MGDPNKMTPALGRHRHSRSRGSDEFIYKIDSPSQHARDSYLMMSPLPTDIAPETMAIGMNNQVVAIKNKKNVAGKSSLKNSRSMSKMQAPKALNKFTGPSKKKKKANKTRMQDFINAYGCTTIQSGRISTDEVTVAKNCNSLLYLHSNLVSEKPGQNTTIDMNSTDQTVIIGGTNKQHQSNVVNDCDLSANMTDSPFDGQGIQQPFMILPENGQSF